MRVFIDELPRTINQAYEAILLRCPQPEQARKLLLHIISAAVALREMNMVFNIERGPESREEVDLYPEESLGTYFKNLCGLFVGIFDSDIFLLHQTVKGFLLLPKAVTTCAVKHIGSGDVWKHYLELEESTAVYC